MSAIEPLAVDLVGEADRAHEAAIEARADAILADMRAQCQTLRRSMGQRFRKIARDSLERFAALQPASEPQPESWDDYYMRMVAMYIEALLDRDHVP